MKLISLNISFILSSFYFFLCSSIPYDLLNNRYMNFNWLEFGQVTAPAYNNWAPWTTVTTTTVIPITGKVIAFLSIPEVDALLPTVGGLVTGLPPLVPKMNGRPHRNSDGTYSFQFRLVHPNDSQCSRQWYNSRWYTPTSESLYLPMTWLVAVEGAYSILTNYTDPNFNTNFIIGSGNITRASAAPIVTNSNGNAIQFLYPSGCDKKPSEICYVQTTCGAIQQLQTSVNTVDNGHPFFLSVRAWVVRQRSSWFVLVPHDSSTASYFVIQKPEILGYIVFPTGQALSCLEGFAFETRTYTNVTSHPIQFPFSLTYTGPPGVFGMIGSVVSLVDSTTLSVYDVKIHNSTIITKEDQCVDEEFSHITPETIHLLIVGRAILDPWLQCFAIYNTEPTPAPTWQPTSSPTRHCQVLEVIK
mmetsp:Transcript_5179/g.5300  ORF Transcript_5179/g.5300 Transcript_5179/m.5300 type:complete len:415 (+) Transcript_5179:42-1286(+)